MTTGCSFTSRSMSSRTSLIGTLPDSSARRRGSQRQGVDRRHEVAEGVVHEPMLLDEPERRERGCDDVHVEVVAGSGRVRDLDPGVGEPRLDAATHLVLGGHQGPLYAMMKLE